MTETPEINHDSPIPLYIQMETILSDFITNGVYKDGEKLPSENQLCKTYSVSRITVRQALNILEKKDLVYSVAGKGTFVKLQRIDQGLMKITTFKKTLEQKGMEGHTDIVYYGDVKDRTNKIKKIFELDSIDDIVQLDLVGLGNKSPLVYYKSFFPSDLGKQIYNGALEMGSESAFSTFDLYAHLNINLEEITQKLSAETADKQLSSLLKIPVKSAVLILESFIYGDGGKLFEYKLGFYRSDKYHFTIKREL